MGGCRCSYKNCPNTTKTTENVHFFHYPVKHKERCKIWIENANKPQFCNLEEDQLRNKVICEYHFEEKWFPNIQKKRLLQGAIPTLDVGCYDDEVEQAQEPIFISSELHDVQVLPANADGTIFILDTDSMFNRSPKVESYIYKNGAIVPSNLTQVKPDIAHTQLYPKPSTSTVINSINDECLQKAGRFYDETQTQQVIEEPQEDYKVFIKNETPEYIEATSKYTYQKNVSEKMDEATEQYEPHDPKQVYEISNLPKRVVHNPSSVKQIVGKSPVDKTFARNYLRKIKQHSREIASIKKMLKRKTFSESTSGTSLIPTSMKEQLPSTFYTMLNLNLNNKCELSEDDVDFFTTIHRTSAEVYQLLINKYKWNLPCIDFVKNME